MAARRALEWIGTSKAQLLFRYEILDLFPCALLSFWTVSDMVYSHGRSIREEFLIGLIHKYSRNRSVTVLEDLTTF